MAEILFLAHRIPYPPDKGDKIRSWNVLKHLIANHSVHLGCFVDDPTDFDYLPELRNHVASLKAVAINPVVSKIKSLGGYLTNDALSVTYYRNREMSDWVKERVGSGSIDKMFLFSSPMAQFALPYADSTPIIMDFVDMDSDKWTQYASSKGWPMSSIYRREAGKLARYEHKVAQIAECSLLVTADETAFFRQQNPDVHDKILTVQNGVDTAYYDPETRFDRPVEFGEINLIFTGAMDYWANVDAVDWFASEVLPLVRARFDSARFIIVGSKPTARVRALGARDGVVVTGRVPDVRPYLAHATVVVAPMRIARGVQNKVLEGMAMARRVVTTPQGFEGIEATPGRDLYVEDNATEFADRLLSLCEPGATAELGAAARQVVVDGYSWSAQLAILDELIDQRKPGSEG